MQVFLFSTYMFLRSYEQIKSKLIFAFIFRLENNFFQILHINHDFSKNLITQNLKQKHLDVDVIVLK